MFFRRFSQKHLNKKKSAWGKSTLSPPSLPSAPPELLRIVVLVDPTADRLAQLVEYRAGGRGFEPRPDQHLGSSNNWGESAAFVMPSGLSSLLG